MTAASGDEDAKLIAECRRRAIALLLENLTQGGIRAARPTRKAAARGYGAIFGRDVAVCALGMAVSGDARLQAEAATGLLTLAEHQAGNGQIPKFVDTQLAEADFWYLGCIDATLWWLAAIALLDRMQSGMRLRRRLAGRIRKAIAWLECQEHQRFFLLQQNEASDWADIMPRSGFVLYSNALWYLVKRLYRLERAAETRANANHLFHPFGAQLAQYRRARLLAHYARNTAHNRALYLSFVNFAFFGDEGDAFGNVLAILCGLADERRARGVLNALLAARLNDPYPIRVLCDPVPVDSFLWRPYMTRHHQNLPWQYQQRRHMALRRRLLDSCAAGVRHAQARAHGAGEACAREPARLLVIQRVAARPDVRALRDGEAIMERRRVPFRLACRQRGCRGLSG